MGNTERGTGKGFIARLKGQGVSTYGEDGPGPTPRTCFLSRRFGLANDTAVTGPFSRVPFLACLIGARCTLGPVGGLMSQAG